MCGEKYNKSLSSCPRCNSKQTETALEKWYSLSLLNDYYGCEIILTMNRFIVVSSLVGMGRRGGIFAPGLLSAIKNPIVDIPITDVIEVYNIEKREYGLTNVYSVVRTKSGEEYTFKKFREFEKRRLLEITEQARLHNCDIRECDTELL